MQRYTDQFLHIINKLGWDLAESKTVFAFKKGLSTRMLEPVNNAETSFHLVSRTMGLTTVIMPVDQLIAAVMSVEANLALKTTPS